MKTILISIHKRHNENIFDTKLKTEEIRKVKPKLELPFKVVVYEPLGKKHKYNGKYCKTQNCNDCNGEGCYEGCGKVVGEFIVDEIGQYYPCYSKYDIDSQYSFLVQINGCITATEVQNYGKGKSLYGWHITAPKRYDKPKELGEFRTVRIVRGYHKKGETKIERLQNSDRVEVTYLTRPPQNYIFIQEV